MNLKLSLLSIFIFLFQISNAQQKVIELNNPSFEDFPRPGVPPRGWFDCGRMDFPNETPPDIHPIHDNTFGVTQTPFDGTSYLGMVVRENDTWESVSQKLEYPLKEGKCYIFSIYLSRSDSYTSAIRGKDGKVKFKEPLTLRIWGGNGYCEKAQLLAESDEVYNTIWEKFTFYFTPNEKVKYIRLEAFYKSRNYLSPNGNILLDNASPIQLISCDDEEIKLIRTKIKQKRVEDYFEQSKINNEIQKVFVGTTNIIEPLGNDIKFENNNLISESVLNIKAIAHQMKNLSDFKLIIDFNGIKRKRAKIRTESLIEVFQELDLTPEDYEIRNSTKEDDDTFWLIDKDDFYLGIIKKNK